LYDQPIDRNISCVRRRVSIWCGSVALAAVAGLLSACSGHQAAKAVPPVPVPHVCPLTDLPAPSGKVPARPALAIKVENLPAARPQFGLGQADVVYEQPVEGGITRFIAIFQCSNSTRVEPVRSARSIDPGLVMQFGAHPLFGYAGAAQPVVSKVDASPLIDVGINRVPSAYWRDHNRVAPHNLVTSTGALWAAGASKGAKAVAPSPVFTYGHLPAGGRPAASVHIAYRYSSVTWTWHSEAGLYLRSYADTGPASLGGGGQISAANVVIMHMVAYPSTVVKDVNGVPETLLVLTGSGPAEVVRGGVAVPGTWNRPTLAVNTRLLDPHGHEIPLAPGTTWVELVPTTVPYTIAP
jgi:hypothetical protein